MRKRYLFLCLIALPLISNHAHAQSPPSQVYMLCFLGNGLSDIQNPDSGSCIYFASYSDTTHISITCRAYPAYKKMFTLLPFAQTRYKIWRDINIGLETSEQVNDTAILITSDHPIVCVTLPMVDEFPGDGSITYPKNQYTGTEFMSQYMVMSYPVDKDPRDSTVFISAPSVFAVGAFEDSTQITISLKSDTWSGADSAVIQHYLLMRGQCVQIYSSIRYFYKTYDFTGSLVQSNKPISVYCGTGFTSIPTGTPSGTANNWDNANLFEAVPPLTTWGKYFLCRLHAPRLPGYYNIGDRPFDVVRVLSANANTLVSINGVPWVTLGYGEYRDTFMRGVFAIESSQPVLVAQYDHQKYAGDIVGGPDMAIVPPLEQRSNDFRFFSFHDFEDIGDGFFTYNSHYVVICGDESIKNTITLDGSPLPDTGFVDVPTSLNGEKLVIGSYAIDSGFHHISTTSPKGMTLLVYGGGDGFGYAYGMGSLSAPNSGVTTVMPHTGRFSVSPDPLTSSADFQFDELLLTTNFEIFDILGRSLTHESLPAGDVTFHFSMQPYPPGTYFARLGEKMIQFVKM